MACDAAQSCVEPDLCDADGFLAYTDGAGIITKLPEGSRASGKTVSFAESASELGLSSDESEVKDVEEASSSDDNSGSNEEESSDEGA